MAYREMKIVFFGTSEFGSIILEKLVQAGLSPVLVVTTPDNPAGRKQELTPPPIKVTAQKLGILVMQPEKLDQDTRYKIQNTNPDLFVVASYGKILPKEILDMPKFGALNVHPSLLPKYRGASPIQTAILNGEDETGVTIMLMDEKMDHGAILAQQELRISNDEFLISKPTYPELHNKLAEIGAELLVKTIPDWIEGKIKPVPQNEGKATYTHILKKEDGRIDWNKEAVYIERQVRAMYPWPGTYTFLKSKILKILKADIIKNIQGEPRKAFQTADGKLAVYAGKDAILLEEIQMEGGKPMSSKEFLLGHRDCIGTTLE